MQLELNDEQLLLKDSVERFIERTYTFEKRQATLAGDAWWDRDLWRQFADLGWLGAGLPESAGGFGGGALEQVLIGEALGRAMVLEPFVSTAVVGAHALELADNAELGATLLNALVAGDLVLALAAAEPGARFDLHHVATRATPSGNTFTLSGHKHAVLDGPGADRIIVSARVDGDTRDEHGIALFLVDADAAGTHANAYRTPDGSAASDLHFDGTPAELLVDERRGLAVLERIVERGIAVRTAQAAGAMDCSFGQTLEYVKTREQFDTTIGSFQVVQHRLVDLLIAVRECQARTRMVASDVMSEDATTRRAAVAAAKAYVGKRARRVAQEVVQLHGGVGMTEELAIGHFFRYLTQYCSVYGSTAHHLSRYTALVT